MCQLTFIDAPSEIAKGYLMNLTIINAKDGNTDGYGMYSLSSGKYFRSTKSGLLVLQENGYFDALNEMCPSDQVASVISHVRSASRGTEVCDENTHPFILNNLILAHNGTLEATNQKYELKKGIDSFWFLSRLVEIVGGRKLSAKHISTAMKDFRGKFAFLINDLMAPEIVWIVKGKAPLHYSYLLEDEKEIGFIVNTDRINLSSCIYPAFLRIQRNKVYQIKPPESFDDESIYQYNVVSKELIKTQEKIEERPLVTTITTWGGEDFSDYSRRGMQQMFPSQRSQYNYGKSVYSTRALDFLSCAEKFNLTFQEMAYAHLVLHNRSIFLSSEDSVKDTITHLEGFTKDFDGAKAHYWKQILKAWEERYPGSEILDLYDNYKIKFPFFLETKSRLKHVLAGVKKRDSHRKNFSKTTQL